MLLLMLRIRPGRFGVTEHRRELPCKLLSDSSEAIPNSKPFGLSSRVMLVEEVGQVLEAHILGSLVSTVEHLILIGDPQQLRPTLNNYGKTSSTWYIP